MLTIAVALPIPMAAPVTIATLPLSTGNTGARGTSMVGTSCGSRSSIFKRKVDVRGLIDLSQAFFEDVVDELLLVFTPGALSEMRIVALQYSQKKF
jgi:hypothetical protein